MSFYRRPSICTYTGIEFWPTAPRAEDVWGLDIARALSRECRFNGHVAVDFYSVAQHSVLVSECAERLVSPMADVVDPGIRRTAARWGLLHDAAEAYVADVSSPVKPWLTGYDRIERALLDAIAQRFGMPREMPPEVKEADRAVFGAEIRCGIMPRRSWWSVGPDDSGQDIEALGPAAAQALFEARFEELFGEEAFDALWRPT